MKKASEMDFCLSIFERKLFVFCAPMLRVHNVGLPWSWFHLLLGFHSAARNHTLMDVYSSNTLNDVLSQ